MARKALGTCFALLLLGLCSACGPNGSDNEDSLIDQVNIALSSGDCQTAIALIDPVYNSGNSNNQIRMVRASAYACQANLSFFPMIGTIASNSSQLAGNGFWSLMAQLFPSSLSNANDRVVESANGAIDALMSVFNYGQVVNPSYEISATGFNPESEQWSDRTSDSNAYLVFVGMAAIGGYENRYGDPTSAYLKQTNLPWTTAVTVDANGCGFASAIVNFMDGLQGMSGVFTGSTASTIQTIQTEFQSLISLSCNLGCTNTLNPLDTGSVHTGCTVTPTTCSSTCPMTLRDRTSCTGLASDVNSCAAAGIVNFINSDPVGWQTAP